MSETISLPVEDMGRDFTRYTKSEAVGRCFQRCASVAMSKRASKRPIPGHSKKVQACGAVVGAGGTICLKQEPPEHSIPSGSHSRGLDVFSGAGARATRSFADFASIPGMWILSPSPSNMTEVESKSSGHLIHTRSPSRSEYFPGLQSRNPGQITRNS